MGYHDLIDRPGMPLLSHTEGGRFITPRKRTVWISVRAWRRQEGRSGIPDARARTHLVVPFAAPIDATTRMQDSGVRLAYQSGYFYVERVVPFSFLFFS